MDEGMEDQYEEGLQRIARYAWSLTKEGKQTIEREKTSDTHSFLFLHYL